MARAPESSERTIIERRDPLLGEVIDQQFRVEAKIAAGGFGAIYRVTDLTSEQQFALKVLHPKLTGDPNVVARFRREGAALIRLRDPHTITAYDLGEAPDGTLYIVMELLRGESLYERFRAHGPLPWRRVLAIARAVCSSLAEAHALGIIHRDLKPTNIHLEPCGEGDLVKVLDFGIAKILRDSDIEAAELTNAGQMVGTIDYMSPEQMVGGECTAASDLYTLGIVMYEMIAGKKPFADAPTPAAALAAALTTTPERLSARALVTAEVDRIVMRCLERQHTDRFQSAAELAAALDDILDDEVITHQSPALHDLDGGVPGFATTLPGRPSLGPPTAPEAAQEEPVDTAPHHALALTRAVAREFVVAGPAAPAPAPPAPAPSSAPAAVSASVSPPGPAAPGASVAPPAAIAQVAPAAPVASPARVAANAPSESPFEFAATLIGHHAPSRTSAAGRSQMLGTPPVGTPPVPINLREAYPTIHRMPPSPTRPQALSAFDDRAGTPPMGFGTAPSLRPTASLRRLLVIVIALAIALATAIALAWR